MIDDKARADGYATIHAALHSLRSRVITFEEFIRIVKELRRDLEQKQSIAA